MATAISAAQFHSSSGVEDWRVLQGSVSARFRTGDFARGIEFVRVIGDLADAANHHPDVDLRYGEVTITLVTHDVGGLSELDVELARQISQAAGRLQISADPAAVETVDIAIDVLDIDAVRPFWRAVLGYEPQGDAELVDPEGRLPGIWFQTMDSPRPQRNRIHLDVYVPHDQAQDRLAGALASGGHLVTDAFAPQWWTLADAEGNEVDICTWQPRGSGIREQPGG